MATLLGYAESRDESGNWVKVETYDNGTQLHYVNGELIDNLVKAVEEAPKNKGGRPRKVEVVEEPVVEEEAAEEEEVTEE